MATITTEVVTKLVTEHGNNEKDTGNPRVQIAILSHRISEITEHLKVHRKDVHSRRGLTTLVAQRRRLLNYLQRENLADYRELVKKLNLRR